MSITDVITQEVADPKWAMASLRFILDTVDIAMTRQLPDDVIDALARISCIADEAMGTVG